MTTETAVADRFATEHDFDCNRDFCYIHLEIDRLGAKVSGGKNTKIHRDKAGHLFFVANGSIKQAPLGQYRVQSASAYRQAGTIVDYAENIDAAIVTAKEVAEKFRQKCIDDLFQQVRDFSLLKVEVAVNK